MSTPDTGELARALRDALKRRVEAGQPIGANGRMLLRTLNVWLARGAAEAEQAITDAYAEVAADAVRAAVAARRNHHGEEAPA